MPSIVNNLPVVKEENQNAGGAGDNQAQGQQQGAPGQDDKNKAGEQKQNEAVAEGDKKKEDKKEEDKK